MFCQVLEQGLPSIGVQNHSAFRYHVLDGQDLGIQNRVAAGCNGTH